MTTQRKTDPTPKQEHPRARRRRLKAERQTWPVAWKLIKPPPVSRSLTDANVRDPHIQFMPRLLELRHHVPSYAKRTGSSAA